jgi:glycosyltransferase involved in cell wall biosynthesis
MKVSIIIPVYNVQKYIERCIRCVCNQTYQNIEIIIVNDGSTDTSPEYCKKYAQKYEKIIYVEKENEGLVSAWKTGLNYATGEYICFIDSDDYVSLDYVETFVKAVEPDIDMVCMSCTQYFDNGEERLFHINTLPEGVYDMNDDLKSRILNDKGAYFRVIAVSRWGKLIKTELVRKYSGYCTEKISYGEDQQLTVGIMSGCRKIKILDEYKYYYQFNMTSILNSYKKEMWEKVQLLMDTIAAVPDIRMIPDFERQYNSQLLIYGDECLKNQFYHGKLSKNYFNILAESVRIQNALGNFYSEKMRFLDRKMLQYIKERAFLKLRGILTVYYIYCKLKRQPL